MNIDIREQVAITLRELTTAREISVQTIASLLNVSKDTIYSWRGPNASRWVGTAKAEAVLTALISLYTPEETTPITEETQEPDPVDQEEPIAEEENTPPAEEVPTPDPTPTSVGIIGTKDLAAELGTTPRELRKWLRNKFGKTEGRWEWDSEDLTLASIKEQFRGETH